LTGAPAPRTRALSAAVARTVRRLMIGVVHEGTGTAAAVPGITVAGKTGTAELKNECQSPAAAKNAEGSAEASAGEGGGEASGSGCQAGGAANTDAWFAAFAPAVHPRVDVGVLLVKDGAGGQTAAPVAREVLETGLRR
jgi:cell division protein FtsI/penicillin-binding protein 2